MSQLIFFVVALLDIDEDAEVVLAGAHADAGTGEFGADLIETARRYASLGAVDVEGGDWGVVGGLFCQVAHLDFVVSVRDGGGAIGGGGDSREVRFLGDVVIDFPGALRCLLAIRAEGEREGRSYPEEFTQGGVVWFAGFPLDIFLCRG